MDSDRSKKIEYLFYRYSDGSITKEEMDSLNSLILESEYVQDKYFEFLKTEITLSRSFQENILVDTNSFQNEEDSKVLSDSNTSLRGVDLEGFMADPADSDMTGDLLEILEMVRTSPAVEKEKPEPVEPERELIQKVESDFKWFPGRPSKHKTRTLLAMVASIMVTIGCLYFFAPENIDRPVVAKLADSIDAVWDNELQVPDEFGDMVQSRYRLQKGYATILFSDGAKVTVEAPAEVSLESPSAMELFSGRIYSIVPSRAKGFAVTAASSKIVDLGTEFGVEVDSGGNTQLHVTKGRTVLFSGLTHGKKDGVQVDAGMAKKVYNDGFVKDIPVAKEKFARSIDSKSDIVLREMQLSLADIVGGGNGFGTGNKKQSIDPISGKVTSDFVFELREGQNRYLEVGSMPYVDGVFVPDGGVGPIKVSSEGDMFENCIDTSGGCYRNITNYFSKDASVEESKFRHIMNGVQYGTGEKNAISMHSNTGITFDLNRIRKSIPDVRVTSFSALCGIAGKINQMTDYKATFYVLVDGKKRFEISASHKELLGIPVRIKLSDQDRFLTLIAADGRDTCGRDWCMFAMPVLELVETD